VSELATIVNLTQESMEEVACAVMNGEELLQMREAAKQVPIIDEVMEYTMKLVSSTHPDGPMASEAAKKYVKYGSSPRGAQNLVTGAKVRALMDGRYNVSYDDINTLALPVLRHRIKLNFEAVTSNITPDTLILDMIRELNEKPNSLKDLLTNPDGKKGKFTKKINQLVDVRGTR